MPVDFKDYSRRMEKALDHLAEEFGAVRAGRANAKVLEDNLKATDITAMALAMDNDMTMVCFGLDEENSIVRVVRGEAIGTTVKNEF